MPCAGSGARRKAAARIFGDGHSETLRYRSSLANCHYAAGNTALAIELFGELFTARRAELGENHPDTLRSRGSLANALYSVGRYAEAAALHRRNVADREEALGPEHPSAEASRRNLARTIANLGGEPGTASG